MLSAGAWFWIRATPTSSGSFVPGHGLMPESVFAGSTVTVRGFRDFEHRSEAEFTERYLDHVLDLDKVESVWYVLTPFSDDWRGPAHSFLSFGFTDSTFVSISVEARREDHEEYSMLGGLLHRYEVMYVIGSEEDLIGLRAAHRDPAVLLYPMRATPEGARALLVQMLERANALKESPEYYNTLINNCTTNILNHVNSVAPDDPIPYGPRVLLPGYSDQLAFDRGLIDTDLSLEQARERFRINERAKAHADDPHFSMRIRQDGPA